MGKDRHQEREAGRGPAFLQLNHYMLKSPAWRALGPYARCLYVEMRARYNGRNNGEISMSYREAEELLNCSNKPVPGAFRELQEKGFIKPVRKGAFSWKVRFEGQGRATTWLLTDLRQDYPEQNLQASKDFMHWKPEAENKTRHAEGGPYARLKRAISDPMARPKRTNDTLKAGHFDENAVQHGTLKAGTYNIPCTPAPVGQASQALISNLKQRGWSGKKGRGA